MTNCNLFYATTAILNPSHPNISMHVLHTVFYTFLQLYSRRICLTIKSFVGDHFHYSQDLNE